MMALGSRSLFVSGALILALQAMASYTLRREPFLPAPPALSTLPTRLGDWTLAREGSVEPEILEVLGPDDGLAREYQSFGRQEGATLFVAYYKTQLRAKNAHDPKVCLPGAGWNATVSRVIEISMPESTRSFPANYYRIAKAGNEAVVLYWFQTYNGVYTFEQQLRGHRLLDAIFANRTDMALVRILMPLGDKGVEAADAGALGLARLIYPQMLAFFPPKESPQR